MLKFKGQCENGDFPMDNNSSQFSHDSGFVCGISITKGQNSIAH
jgi:hypothetical protein